MGAGPAPPSPIILVFMFNFLTVRKWDIRNGRGPNPFPLLMFRPRLADLLKCNIRKMRGPDSPPSLMFLE